MMRVAGFRLNRRWVARAGAMVFALALLYPFTALFAHIGGWQWDEDVRETALASVRVSLLLTTAAMAIIVAVGTPIAVYVARCGVRERLVWQAVLLIPILLPPLALGILLSLAFGPYGSVGRTLQHMGVVTTNSASSFVATQVYVGMGYYVLGARCGAEDAAATSGAAGAEAAAGVPAGDAAAGSAGAGGRAEHCVDSDDQRVWRGGSDGLLSVGDSGTALGESAEPWAAGGDASAGGVSGGGATAAVVDSCAGATERPCLERIL